MFHSHQPPLSLKNKPELNAFCVSQCDPCLNGCRNWQHVATDFGYVCTYSIFAASSPPIQLPGGDGAFYIGRMASTIESIIISISLRFLIYNK